MGGKPLNAPIVGMAATPNGGGYWLVGADGGVFAFGNAKFYGSMGGKNLNKPIVGIAASQDGNGYYLVASDGGIFSFGDAKFYGSLGSDRNLVGWVTSISSVPGGYYLFGSDGGVYAFGSAQYEGRVVYPPPALTFSASPSLIQQGQSTNLSWSTTNSINATIIVEGDSLHGPYQPNQSITLTPQSYGKYNYKLIVIGAGGYVTKSLQITVLPPVPAVSVAANFYSVPLGGVSEICWSTSWAGSVSVSLLGNVPANGCRVWTSTSLGSQNLTITGTGYGGTTTASAPQPIVVYQPTPTTGSSSNPANNSASQDPPGSILSSLPTSIPGQNYEPANLPWSLDSNAMVCLDFSYDPQHPPTTQASVNFVVSGQVIGQTGNVTNTNGYMPFLMDLNNASKGSNDTATSCDNFSMLDHMISSFAFTGATLPPYTGLRNIRLVDNGKTYWQYY